MAEQTCRWGILGTANIARKNWQAIRNAGNSSLVAVASRDRDKARRFIDECQGDVSFTPVPVPCGSYEELLARKDIDAVYIPLPTGIRKEWVVRAAQSGKHVLCEKPCGTNAADVRAMLDACRQAGVQFMDGVMFMHSARLPLMRQALDDSKSIGDLRRIATQFSFLGSEEFLRGNIRVSSDLEPLGCLGDLGWYNIRFSLWVMRERLPESVTGRILGQHRSGARPVPIEFSGELFFSGGVSASFYCSFQTENQQTVIVSGTKGYFSLRDFVLPHFGSTSAFEVHHDTFRVRGCEFAMEDHTTRMAAYERSNNAPDAQETNMIRTFASIVTSGRLEPKWAENALNTQIVLDACLRSAEEDGRRLPVGRAF
jgi:predicted dehydrogenase